MLGEREVQDGLAAFQFRCALWTPTNMHLHELYRSSGALKDHSSLLWYDACIVEGSRGTEPLRNARRTGAIFQGVAGEAKWNVARSSHPFVYSNLKIK